MCNCNLGIPINRETQACSSWWKYSICEYLLIFRATPICRMCVIATWGFQLTVRLRLATPGENTIYVKFYYTLGHQYFSHVCSCNLGIPVNRETQACSSWWEYNTCAIPLLCRAPVSVAFVSLRPVVLLCVLARCWLHWCRYGNATTVKISACSFAFAKLHVQSVLSHVCSCVVASSQVSGSVTSCNRSCASVPVCKRMPL